MHSTKEGIMISLKLLGDKMDITTEGFDWQKDKMVYETIQMADCLLADLIFGTTSFQAAAENHEKIEMMKSAVKTYKNPYDVKLGNFKGNWTTSAKMQNGECNFKSISPYPKFVINKDASIVIKKATNGTYKICCDACPLKIMIRGIYEDFHGNIYFDDNGFRCYPSNPFFYDFGRNFSLYLEAYPILMKLASYAIFIGVIRNIDSKNMRKIEIYKSMEIKFEPKNVCETIEKMELEFLQQKEKILRKKIGNEENGLLSLIAMGDNWRNFDTNVAKNYYLEVLLEVNETITFTEYFLKKKIIAKACLGLFFCIFENPMTNGERKLLKHLFNSKNAKDFDLKLSLINCTLEVFAYY